MSRKQFPTEIWLQIMEDVIHQDARPYIGSISFNMHVWSYTIKSCFLVNKHWKAMMEDRLVTTISDFDAFVTPLLVVTMLNEKVATTILGNAVRNYQLKCHPKPEDHVDKSENSAVDVPGKSLIEVSLRECFDTAMLRGFKPCIQILLEHTPSHFPATVSTTCAVSIAMRTRRADIAELLVLHGANLKKRAFRLRPHETTVGYELLCFAARNNEINLAKMLLDRDVPVETENAACFPIEEAVAAGHCEMAMILTCALEAAGESDVKESDEETGSEGGGVEDEDADDGDHDGDADSDADSDADDDAEGTNADADSDSDVAA